MKPEPALPSPEGTSWARLDRALRTVIKVSREAILREEASEDIGGLMSERIISTQPCPVCHGTKRCGGEVCSNCNGTGNVPVYEEDRDYKPSED